MLNVLVLYNETQTYTNTVFDHLNSFATLSKNNWRYRHYDKSQDCELDLTGYDAVVVHYSIRICFLQLGELISRSLKNWRGIKVLFIQDEYDAVFNARQEIRSLGFNLVFTAVPEQNITRIYPAQDFPNTRFVSCLTGYVAESEVTDLVDTLDRPIFIGYRGRTLPIRYGALAREKFLIGELVKNYCMKNQIPCDIETSETARYYGKDWSRFISKCRSMLGSESGSNVFDFDGTLNARIDSFRRENPSATDAETYQNLIAPLELESTMNQISPKIFEAITYRSLLVLFEGRYSEILSPWYHYIPLKKDGSNLNQVMALLHDDKVVTEITNRAYDDIVDSRKYSYTTLVERVDSELANIALSLPSGFRKDAFTIWDITTKPFPNKAASPNIPTGLSRTIGLKDLLGRLVAWWGR